MVKTVIAKVTLAPLVPFWKDRLNGYCLEKDEILEVTDNMILKSIREGLTKGYICLVEGSLPEESNNNAGSSDCACNLTEDIVENMIENAVDNITHPECNLTSDEKQSILNRLDKLENGVVIPPTEPEDPEPEQPIEPDEPGDDYVSIFDPSTYVWKEVYKPNPTNSTIDITGSKIIKEWKESGGDDGTFWDDFEAGKYELYAPRLQIKNYEQTTEADDIEDTFIPLDGINEELRGKGLVNVSKSLENVDWMITEMTTNTIDLGVSPTTNVVFYLIKRTN